MLRIRTRESVRLIQFANDWVMVETATQPNAIVSPTALRVETEEEREQFESTKDDPSVGTFWREWELLDDGRFKRKKMQR